ncbi:hypothetical protein, partial [Cronobacter sakazakii]|uniref:hypothetical protein n=1 Tax=Cronobacter sakazakii TaxID=28141 RepID=UPI001C672EE9
MAITAQADAEEILSICTVQMFSTISRASDTLFALKKTHARQTKLKVSSRAIIGGIIHDHLSFNCLVMLPTY